MRSGFRISQTICIPWMGRKLRHAGTPAVPRGTRPIGTPAPPPDGISVHASLASSGAGGDGNMERVRHFNPLPLRGATLPARGVGTAYADFNPRFPRGERPRLCIDCLASYLFQSTLPSRVATQHGVGGEHDPHHFNPRFPRGWRRCKCARCPEALRRVQTCGDTAG